MAKYDFLIVGAGLFGSTFAQRASEKGKRCLVLERRNHVGGAVHCDELEGVPVQRYGPHVFHTRSRAIWEYVNRFARFNSFLYSPVAACRDAMYNLPVNMNTFHRLWDVRAPEEAQERVRRQSEWEGVEQPKNLEERCLKQYGRDVYEKLIRPYEEKRWGRPCREVPADVTGLPLVRYTYDNRWYDDPWQGVPSEGYDVMIKRMLAASELMLGTDYLPFIRVNQGIADKIIYTGAIDEYFRYKQGTLEYRSLRWEHEVLSTPDYQGAAVVFYPEPVIPFLRTIEYQHFWSRRREKTVITKEFAAECSTATEPCFPVNDAASQRAYISYKMLAVAQPDVTFAGRLGVYQWFEMDETVQAALDLADQMTRK